MAVNPLGFQKISDYGIPKIITALAADVISGGQYVYAVSGTAPVSSGLSSFAYGDFSVNVPASGTNYPVGVCTQNTGSNTPCPIILEGVIISQADGAINTGVFVGPINGAHAVTAVGSQDNPILALNRVVGRALTAAGSEQFVVHTLNL